MKSDMTIKVKIKFEPADQFTRDVLSRRALPEKHIMERCEGLEHVIDDERRFCRCGLLMRSH